MLGAAELASMGLLNGEASYGADGVKQALRLLVRRRMLRHWWR